MTTVRIKRVRSLPILDRAPTPPPPP